MNLSKKLAFWLLVGILSLPLITSSYGVELLQEEITAYLRISLGNSNGVVRKSIKTGRIAMQRTCTSTHRDKCNNAILNKRIGDSFGRNNRIKVRVTSQNPDFKFIFADTSIAIDKKRELSELYIGGFSDSDDTDCQLYYSIEENVIEKVAIVVSLDAPELKQKLCLALQLSQGLGLSLPSDMSFSKVWKRPPDELLYGESAFTDDNVARLTKGYSLFSYIHMCPDIKPGMKADDMKRILSGKSTCADGLKRLSEKIER